MALYRGDVTAAGVPSLSRGHLGPVDTAPAPGPRDAVCVKSLKWRLEGVCVWGVGGVFLLAGTNVAGLAKAVNAAI